MQGPYKLGRYSQHLVDEDPLIHRQPVLSQRYRITKAFNDADRHHHPVGEEWVYLGQMFNKFEDEMVFVVQFSGQEEWMIPLSCEDQQGDVVFHWQRYLDPVVAGRPSISGPEKSGDPQSAD